MKWTRTHLALTTVLVLVVGQTAVAQSEGGDTSFESDDGDAALVVPSGAVPAGTDITISYRSPEEAPPELAERIGEGSPSHYLIEPTDIDFDPPAEFTRRIPLAWLESTVYDPQLLGMLAIRDSTGAWSWADDLGYAIDAASESLVFSGDITNAGQVFAFPTGVVWPGEVVAEGYVGEETLTESDFYVQDFLGLPSTYERHDAVIIDAVGTTGDPAVATVGETLVTEDDYGPLVSLPLQCVSPGETITELNYTLDDVGDDILIPSWLELPATAVEISIVGSLECFE